MLERRELQVTVILAAAAMIWPFATSAHGEPAAPEKVSSYAPAGSLLAQLSTSMEALAEALVDAETLEEEKKNFEKHSVTIVVIAQHLALHDEDHDLKAAAPAIFHKAIAVAETEDFESAQAAFAVLREALEGGSSDAELPTWEPAVEMEPLMEQVGFLNSKLRRGVRRLNRNQDEIAQFSATLAALAQAVSPDLSFAGDEEDAKAWMRMCGEMRDAASALHAAAEAGDEDAAKTAIEALDQSCKDCHEKFR